MRVKSEIFITRMFETYLRFPNLLPPKYRAAWIVMVWSGCVRLHRRNDRQVCTG